MKSNLAKFFNAAEPCGAVEDYELDPEHRLTRNI